MTRNPGKQPPETKGKRIRVILENGNPGKGDWAADTAGWKRTGHPFDIAAWEIAE